ncbi:hypothetical protein HDU81_010852 [Chytriomyces hyalinus]|nr:hypothetical protein HDU81_010852 [Chytriomyces hyalinus]
MRRRRCGSSESSTSSSEDSDGFGGDKPSSSGNGQRRMRMRMGSDSSQGRNAASNQSVGISGPDVGMAGPNSGMPSSETSMAGQGLETGAVDTSMNTGSKATAPRLLSNQSNSVAMTRSFSRISTPHSHSHSFNSAMKRPSPIRTTMSSAYSAVSSPSSAHMNGGRRMSIIKDTPATPMPVNHPSSPMDVVSLKKHPSSFSRVATLIKREARPFDEELAHESATMAFLNRINPTLELAAELNSGIATDSTNISPSDSVCLGRLDEVILETTVPLPRTIPIPIAHLRDPASYASHTSKLNPENNSLMYRQPYETASPILSPNTHSAMMLSPVVGRSAKRKMSIGSEDRYEPYKRRIPASPSTSNTMFMSPTTQPMSLPNSPSTMSWSHGGIVNSTSALGRDLFAHPAASSSSNTATNSSVAGGSGSVHSSNSGPATPMNVTQQQPLLPAPVLGLKQTHHSGMMMLSSPMMRRSTSASSAGSNGHSMFMNGDRSGGANFGGGSSAGGSALAHPPGSPRVGVVFGGGANVVVASPRGTGGVGSAGQFGQLLNMGGTQDHLSKMKMAVDHTAAAAAAQLAFEESIIASAPSLVQQDGESRNAFVRRCLLALQTAAVSIAVKAESGEVIWASTYGTRRNAEGLALAVTKDPETVEVVIPDFVAEADRQEFTANSKSDRAKIVGESLTDTAESLGMLSVPLTTSTVFQAASISKPISAMAIMRLVQRGILHLDTDIHVYLANAGWKLPIELPESVKPEAKTTLRQLLAHTAGTSVHGFGGYNRKDVRRNKIEVPSVVGVLNGTGNSGRVVLHGPPRMYSFYSGGGTTIAQLVVETVTGKAMRQVLQEEVFGPLGLENTTATIDDSPNGGDFVCGHLGSEALPIAGGYHLYPETSAAGVWTTPTDLCKIQDAIVKSLNGEPVNGSTYLDASLAKEMLTCRFAGPEGVAFGVGWVVDAKTSWFAHSGGNEGFICDTGTSANSGAGIAWMMSGEGYNHIQEAVNAVKVALNLPAAAKPTKEEYTLPTSKEKVVGTYLFKEASLSDQFIRVSRRSDKTMFEFSTLKGEVVGKPAGTEGEDAFTFNVMPRVTNAKFKVNSQGQTLLIIAGLTLVKQPTHFKRTTVTTTTTPAVEGGPKTTKIVKKTEFYVER